MATSKAGIKIKNSVEKLTTNLRLVVVLTTNDDFNAELAAQILANSASLLLDQGHSWSQYDHLNRITKLNASNEGQISHG